VRAESPIEHETRHERHHARQHPEQLPGRGTAPPASGPPCAVRRCGVGDALGEGWPDRDQERNVKCTRPPDQVHPQQHVLEASHQDPARSARLVKDNAFGKNTPADRYLLPEIDGGSRGQKSMERLLQRSGLPKSVWYAVPSAGVQLDGNGNVKRSHITQILFS
jgi:hypothetical protein